MSLTRLTVALPILLAVGMASADTLRLKNGSTIQGVFVGADSRELQFMGPDGAKKAFAIASVAGVDFGGTPPAAPGPAAPPPAARPSSATRVVIPAGTPITIRMIDSIDSTKTAASERFRASIDDPVVVGSQTVIPRGANCTVQIVQVQENKEMAVKLYDVTVKGKAYDVVAGYAELQAQGTSKGKKAGRRALLGGGVGAGIGAIAGGGKGAAIGAAAGAGLGAISGAAAKGKTLKVPSETRMSFELRTPLALG